MSVPIIGAVLMAVILCCPGIGSRGSRGPYYDAPRADPADERGDDDDADGHHSDSSPE